MLLRSLGSRNGRNSLFSNSAVNRRRPNPRSFGELTGLRLYAISVYERVHSCYVLFDSLGYDSLDCIIFLLPTAKDVVKEGCVAPRKSLDRALTSSKFLDNYLSQNSALQEVSWDALPAIRPST